MANALFYRRRENESQYREPFYLKRLSIRIGKGPLAVKRAALRSLTRLFIIANMALSESDLKVRHQLLLLIGQIIQFAGIVGRGISHASNVTADITDVTHAATDIATHLTLLLHCMGNVRIHILNDANRAGYLL